MASAWLSGGAPRADDGSAPAALRAAIEAYVQGRAGIREVVGALATERLLVPLLEVSCDLLEGSDTDPCAGQDRAVAAVSVRAADGVVGLAFTSLGALARWDARARPWPTPAPRVAAALLADGGVRLVVDPGAHHCVTLAGLALRRLAEAGAWPEPWDDPEVRAAVVGVLAPVLASGELRVRLGPPEPAQPPDGMLVQLGFPAGTDAAVARARAEVVASRLGADPDLRSVFDGVLAVRVQ